MGGGSLQRHYRVTPESLQPSKPVVSSVTASSRPKFTPHPHCVIIVFATPNSTTTPPHRHLSRAPLTSDHHRAKMTAEIAGGDAGRLRAQSSAQFVQRHLLPRPPGRPRRRRKRKKRTGAIVIKRGRVEIGRSRATRPCRYSFRRRRRHHGCCCCCRPPCRGGGTPL